jgi:hypothetical protein
MIKTDTAAPDTREARWALMIRTMEPQLARKWSAGAPDWLYGSSPYPGQPTHRLHSSQEEEQVIRRMIRRLTRRSNCDSGREVSDIVRKVIRLSRAIRVRG